MRNSDKSIEKLIIQLKSVLRSITEPNLTEAEDINKRWQEHRRTIQKKVFMTQITMMVWSHTHSQTSWNAKSSGP